jgi:hypothetical protein
VRRLEHNAFKVELAQRVAVRALQPSRARARTPGAVAADVLVRDGRLVMARRNLHIPYVELLACNGLPTLVGDGATIGRKANGPKAVFSFSANH